MSMKIDYILYLDVDRRKYLIIASPSFIHRNYEKVNELRENKKIHVEKLKRIYKKLKLPQIDRVIVKKNQKNSKHSQKIIKIQNISNWYAMLKNNTKMLTLDELLEILKTFENNKHRGETV